MTYTFLADMTALVAANKGGSGNGNGVQVIITPRGRAPYLVPLAAPPEWSVQAFGGYGPATIRQRRVSGDTSAHLLYADVTIWGRQGPCYRGVVKETERDGTLHCVGIHEALSWHDSAAVGPSTDYSAFFDHVLDEHLPTYFPRPAGWTHVGNNPLTLAAAVTLPAGNLAQQIADICQYSDWEYGWYYERHAGKWVCGPHYAPAPTKPDYIVTLSAEDASAFLGESLEDMADIVVTEWGDPTTRTPVADTDASHYLVAAERHKTAYVSSPNTCSVTDAEIVAAKKLLRHSKTKAGRTAARNRIKRAEKAYKRRMKASRPGELRGVRSRSRLFMAASYGSGGKAATSRIQLASGLDAYYPAIRPGSLARVIIPGGGAPVDLRIAGIDLVGDYACALDLGTDSGRLDALLARVG